MFLAHYYIGLPIAFAYSLAISFFVLYYFTNWKKTNKFFFFLGIIHLSSLFIMPMICCTLVLLPANDLFIDYNDKVYRGIIDGISWANHILNKIIYPICIIYSTSGYVTSCYRFCRLTIKQWIIDLFGIWYSIAMVILYFCFRKFYDNTLDFLLKYLNILDLVKIYIEIGYALGSVTLLYKKAFKKKDEYEFFMLGKLSEYETNKTNQFNKNYQTLEKIYNSYINNKPNMQKYTKIKTFLESNDNNKHIKKDEELGLENNKEQEKPEEIDKNMTEFKLEGLVAEPYGECKGFHRKLERINNLKSEVLNIEKQSQNCLDKLINKCVKSPGCRKAYFIFYFVICGLIIVIEILAYDSPMLDSDNYRNTTKEFDKMQTKRSFEGKEVAIMLFGYPIVFICLFVATAIYVLPLLYSLVNRRIITGDFFYSRDSSDTIDLLASLSNITESVFPCIYLSSVCYGTIYYKSKNEYKFDINVLYFFDIPHSDVILYFRDVYLLVCILLPQFCEYIPFRCCKCCSFKIILSDEFYFNKDCCCYKQKRREYIEEGKKCRSTYTNTLENYPVN